MTYVHWQGLDYFFRDLTVRDASLVLNAWFVPIFIVVLVFLVAGRTPRLNTILRYSALILIPFCWLPFSHLRTYYPRVGYVLWTAGMLLVLLSATVEDRISHKALT